MLWRTAPTERSRPARQGLWQVGRASPRRPATTWPEIPDPEVVPAAPTEPPEAPPEPAPPEPELVFTESDLARALVAVSAASAAAAHDAAAASETVRLTAALEAIAAELATVDAVLERQRQQFREASVTLAALATEAVGKRGRELATQLAEALTSDCLARFDPGLALTIEVAPALADPLAATLDALPAVRDRPGRVAVEAVATLASGEARLVWQDGEASWSIQRLHNEAADLVRRLATPRRTDDRADGQRGDNDQQPDATQGPDAP